MQGKSQRHALELPNGQVVTITATPEIVALASRVKTAFENGERPDPQDVVRLFTYLFEDT